MARPVAFSACPMPGYCVTLDCRNGMFSFLQNCGEEAQIGCLSRCNWQHERPNFSCASGSETRNIPSRSLGKKGAGSEREKIVLFQTNKITAALCQKYAERVLMHQPLYASRLSPMSSRTGSNVVVLNRLGAKEVGGVVQPS